MPYTNKSSINSLRLCYSLKLSNLNSFWIIKTFIVLVICNDLMTIKRNTAIARDTLNVQKCVGVVNENSTKNSAQLQLMPMTSCGVVHANNSGNSILAINNFNGNFSAKNQIISDNVQQHKVLTNDNDSLLLAVEDCTRTTNCGCQTCRRNCCGQISDAGTQAIHKLIKHKATTVTGATLTKSSLPNKSLTSSSSLDLSLPLSLPTSTSSSLSSSGTTKKSFLQQPQQKNLLSRPKRYLSFPEGSSFSVAVCFTVGIIGNPRYNYMSFGLNWGVAYDLPNTTWILNHLHGFAKRPIPLAAWHRRSRRSLYNEIENLVDNMGYNGRDCVLRALCESQRYFQKTKMGMIGEMLRAIFSLPKQRIYTREITENSDIKLYDRAYRKGRAVDDCSETYDCSFSLLELAFGRYSTPPTGYYKQH